MEYNTEEEFLKNYNSNKYEKLSMTTSIVLISVSNFEEKNYRKNSKKMMSILLVKRNTFPYKNKWCLPGGFLDSKKERLEDCARRILKKEANLDNIYLEQLYTFDKINRDPRMRVVSTSFISLIDRNRISEKINENACWFNIKEIIESKENTCLILDNGIEQLNINIKKILREKTTDRYEFISLSKVLAFDGDETVLSGIERIRNKLSYTDIVFNMMAEYFTLGELQQVYEVILGKKLLDSAFRRMIKDKVIRTDVIQKGLGHRPSYLYKYKINNIL